MTGDIIQFLIHYGTLFAVLFAAIYICLRQFAEARRRDAAEKRLLSLRPLPPEWKEPKSIDGSGRWR